MNNINEIQKRISSLSNDNVILIWVIVFHLHAHFIYG